MADTPGNFGKVTVQELKGLNERELNSNSEIGNFDVLRGCLPLTKNTLTKASGCFLSAKFNDEVLSIFQCNDSRKNVIIQLRNSLQIISENELFGITTTPTNLIPVASNEEESMSRAILTHSANQGVAGGGYTTANTWQITPISDIVEQLNPDGTAAAFVSIAGNQMTLVAGIYRIRGYRVLSNATANVRMATRLYNVTAAAPAWAGNPNEVSHALLCGAGNNERLEIGGTLNLAATTIFQVDGLQSLAQATSGMGAPIYKTASPVFTNLTRELFAFYEILKTA